MDKGKTKGIAVKDRRRITRKSRNRITHIIKIKKIDPITKRIIVFGIVQGVGFRPLVYRLANRFCIKGSVKNSGGLVEIIAQGEKKAIDAFLWELEKNNGQGYEILQLKKEDFPLAVEYREFSIADSKASDEIAMIPPDLPICKACEEELYYEKDRRFLNPFISCMSCGARYTIMEELPYDRDNTTMIDYNMCPTCKEEYTDKESRRFHAQTISCYDCGPYLIFQDNQEMNRKQDICKKHVKADAAITESTNIDKVNHEAINTDKVNAGAKNSDKVNVGVEDSLKTKTNMLNHNAFDKAVSVLKSGGIIAVKGIGGYHFVCSPFLEDTVENLRKLKGREEKPFAVMFNSMEAIQRYCLVSEEEKKLLESMARPIVLLYSLNPSFAPSVNKDSNYCGSFLPYTPLQALLTKVCGPLIMTSANLSGQPIIRWDDTLLNISSPYLNGVLYHTRRIIRSVDDSVAKVIDQKPQLIRRSRGYVPYPIFLNKDDRREEILALGGDLKAAFCLYKDGNAFVSQYFGDLEETAILEEFLWSQKDLSKLLNIKPNLIVCDLHPGYHSVNYAESLKLPIYKIQHHHAHIGAVMAEHNLHSKVIGVAFDGTGYGTDGNIWGSEFLICEGGNFKRVSHLKYIRMIGGDSSMKDAKKTASCYLIQLGLKSYSKGEHLEIIEAALKNQCNTFKTSSMGRLFDAVAAILGIQEINQYEGQCAANLEKAAVFALRKKLVPIPLAFTMIQEEDNLEIDMEPVIKKICEAKETEDLEALALGFHYAVAAMIAEVCIKIRNKEQINDVALGGGIFQNTILMERVLILLREKDFQVYYNRLVPPNDGSISLGQAYLALKRK